MLVRILVVLIFGLFTSHAYALRVISLSPYLTESLILLDAEDQLVGITANSRDMFGLENDVVGDTLNINIEKILSLNPDIILLTPMNKIGHIQKLDSLEIDTEYFPMEETFEDCCDSFLRLGRLVGKEKKALQIIKQEKNRLRNIGDVIAKTEAKRIFLEVGNTPLITAGGKCYLNELVSYAGAENVAEDIGERFFRIVRERILELNPDYIIILSENSNVSLKQWMKFQFLKAVSDKNLIILSPDLFSRPNPVSFVNAVFVLAEHIYGDSWREN
ncbi:MAG: helical backbone metal receptor [Candidatus Saelkia tenebricola]|nr:helical backbone metal receptor [Candidatus Saelkia tenebricola]